MRHPRAGAYVDLLNSANDAAGDELRKATHDSQVLCLQLDDAEMTDAHDELNRLTAEDPPGRQGGWDGRFRKAPYTQDGAKRLHEGRFPKGLTRTLRTEQ